MGAVLPPAHPGVARRLQKAAGRDRTGEARPRRADPARALRPTRRRAALAAHVPRGPARKALVVHRRRAAHHGERRRRRAATRPGDPGRVPALQGPAATRSSELRRQRGAPDVQLHRPADRPHHADAAAVRHPVPHVHHRRRARQRPLRGLLRDLLVPARGSGADRGAAGPVRRSPAGAHLRRLAGARRGDLRGDPGPTARRDGADRATGGDAGPRRDAARARSARRGEVARPARLPPLRGSGRVREAPRARRVLEVRAVPRQLHGGLQAEGDHRVGRSGRPPRGRRGARSGSGPAELGGCGGLRAHRPPERATPLAARRLASPPRLRSALDPPVPALLRHRVGLREPGGRHLHQEAHLLGMGGGPQSRLVAGQLRGRAPRLQRTQPRLHRQLRATRRAAPHLAHQRAHNRSSEARRGGRRQSSRGNDHVPAHLAEPDPRRTGRPPATAGRPAPLRQRRARRGGSGRPTSRRGRPGGPPRHRPARRGESSHCEGHRSPCPNRTRRGRGRPEVVLGGAPAPRPATSSVGDAPPAGPERPQPLGG